MREKAEMAGTDAIQKFNTSQSFINFCAEYYGIGFDDCLKQVALAFLELDLSGISMDAPKPMTPTRDVTPNDDVVLESQPSPVADSDVVLAQPAITPPTSISKSSDPTIDVDDALLQKGGDTPANVLDV